VWRQEKIPLLDYGSEIKKDRHIAKKDLKYSENIIKGIYSIVSQEYS